MNAMEYEYIMIVGRGAEELVPVGSPQRVLTFPSLRELDLWRHELSNDGPSIEMDVMAALREIGCCRTDLDDEVLVAIDEMCQRETVPRDVKELIPGGTARRTFYRRWSEVIPESPKKFLGRVRVLHARRLIEQQSVPHKEAAFRAGYASTWLMRKDFLRRTARNAGFDLGIGSSERSE